MQNYRDNLQKFRECNTQVLGISVDSSPAQKEFARQSGVEYPLLSDFKREVSRAYGVFVEDRGFARRATFVIDPKGRIRHIEEGNSAIDVQGSLAAACRAAD